MSAGLLLRRRDVRQAAVPGKFNVRSQERDLLVHLWLLRRWHDQLRTLSVQLNVYSR